MAVSWLCVLGRGIMLRYRVIGPPGSRYRNREPKAIEHLFITLNTLTPVGQTEEGIPNLERIIATHPDFDHITGIDTIFVSCLNTDQAIGHLIQNSNFSTIQINKQANLRLVYRVVIEYSPTS